MENLSYAEKIEKIFNGLNKNTLHLIDEFYHPEIEFHDPIETIKGRKNIKIYYKNMYETAESVSFDFSEMIQHNDTVIAVWKMTLKTGALNSGKPFSVEGNSLVKFKDGLAVYHRDYFDMGAFIYERVPVLSFIINKIKKRMSLDHN